MQGTMLLASDSWSMHHELFRLAKERGCWPARLAHIITADNPARRRQRSQLESAALSAQGFAVVEFDIAGKDEDWLRSNLAGFDIIFVRGGNTFYLLEQVRQSGFGTVLVELLAKGVIYFANSAGSYIVSPTIEAAAWKTADRNCVGMTDLTALNLVPFLVSAHYGPDNALAVDAAAAACGRPVELLTDQEALLVKNGVVTRLASAQRAAA